MLVLGEDPRKAFNEYSKQFQHDFIELLRTSHSTKPVQINHFYQEYIHNKEHVHMNATRWPSLTEFAKYLGREGICRVEEDEKGIHVAWIDNSPEALKRQDAIRKKERMDKGDEEREQKQIEDQIKKAQRARMEEAEGDDEARALKRENGQTISLNFGTKRKADEAKLPSPPRTDGEASGEEKLVSVDAGEGAEKHPSPSLNQDIKPAEPTAPAMPVKMSFGLSNSKPKNVFATKKNPLAAKGLKAIEPPKKMSEAERIMKEEMARKKNVFGGPDAKRQKFG